MLCTEKECMALVVATALLMFPFLSGLLSRPTFPPPASFLDSQQHSFLSVWCRWAWGVFTAHWESIPQTVVRSTCALLRLSILCTIFTWYFSRSHHLFLCFKKECFGTYKMFRNPCWIRQISPPVKKCARDFNSQIECDRNYGFLPFFKKKNIFIV